MCDGVIEDVRKVYEREEKEEIDEKLEDIKREEVVADRETRLDRLIKWKPSLPSL